MPRRFAPLALTSLFASALVLTQCSLALDLSGLTGGPDASPTIAEMGSSSSSTSASSSGTASSSGVMDAGFDAPVVAEFNELREVAKWTTFPIPQLGGYGGGLLVGDRLVLVPLNEGSLLRSFDTRAALTDSTAWSTFDLRTKDTRATGYFGAATDGQYVYYAPYTSSVVARWQFGARAADAAADAFTDSNSYAMHDMSAPGMLTAGYDGRYIYFVPFYHPTQHVPVGKVVRYDTTKSYAEGASWTTFDLTTINANAKNFVGALFDGHAMYFVPGAFGVAARFDVSKAMTDASAWTVFDTTQLCATCFAYEGIAFDGRYAYYAPSARTEGGVQVAKSVTLRLDTTADFTNKNVAWTSFDMRTVHPSGAGYSGAVYDGRYVYFAPSNWSPSGVVMRYDSRAPYTDTRAWTAFDVATVNGRAYGFKGAVFDGKHVYFVPFTTEVMARFEARSERLLPVQNGASRY